MRDRFENRIRGLQARSAAGAEMLKSHMGDARRWKIELVLGTVRSMRYLGRGDEAEFDVEGRKIALKISGEQTLIAEGDGVILAGRARDPFQASLYYNETTGASSLESTHKSFRYLLMGGCLGGLAAFAILAALVLTARHEPVFVAGVGALHVLIYLASVAASGLLLKLSLSLVSIGTSIRKMWLLVQAVTSLDCPPN